MLRAIFAALAFASLIPLPSFAEKITITPGETLSGLAKKYGLSITTLKSLNNIKDPNQLKAGDKLIIPDSDYFEAKEEDPVHKVINGETLSAIALKYRINQQDIISLNDYK